MSNILKNMNKLAVKYAEHILKIKEDDITHASFSYADLGNSYSYGTFFYRFKDGTEKSVQLGITSLFTFIGELL